jgi:type IV fimbrial biogenesis protein FimT
MDIERPLRRTRAGLTLIETLATLATVAVTLAVAVPSYQALAQRNRVTSTAHSLYSHLNLARSEAVERADWVVMCPSRDQTSCDLDFDWSAGWIVFVDGNRDRQRQPAEALVRVADDISPGVTIKTTSIYRRAISFSPDGNVRIDIRAGSNTHFKICVDSTDYRNRAVIVSNVGRPRISKRDPSGRKVSCG